MFVWCPVSCFIEWNLTKSDLGSDAFYEIELDDTSKAKNYKYLDAFNEKTTNSSHRSYSILKTKTIHIKNNKHIKINS